MKGKNNRRVIVRLYKPEVIELIDMLPRGYKSAVIEYALKKFVSSKIGEEICDQLRCRSGAAITNIIG